jgi:hypothetical protein
MVLQSNFPTLCICEHDPDLHENGEFCTGCSCRKYSPNDKQKVILSVAISSITSQKFRNFVSLRHGYKKGGLSFEVERALREIMGEKNLDVLMDDKEWKLLNK